jgi:hypothetical protein
MLAALKKLGYKIVTDKKYLKSADYCVRGGIYVKEGSHTVAGLDNGAKYTEMLEAAGISTKQSPNATGSGAGYYAKYTGNSSSIVDALAAVGEKDTSKAHRKKIATANGIANYSGSSAQNTKLLSLLKKGKLIKA